MQGKPVRVRMLDNGFEVNVKEMRERANDALDLLRLIPQVHVRGDLLSVVGKERVIVKIGDVLQRMEPSEVSSVLKGYDAGLIDRVEVVTHPPLRYDPDGNTAMIILHTSSVFREYMGGVIGTEEMYGQGDKNYRYGGYGSLMYSHKGLFASVSPSLNRNGSSYMERQVYERDERQYRVETPSSGTYGYAGLRGVLQYSYGENKLLGLALSWNRKKYDNGFNGTECVTIPGQRDQVIESVNTYDAKEPRLTGTAYWESAFGQRGHRVWAELSGVSLTNRSRLDFVGTDRTRGLPFTTYLEHNDINTSGVSFNHDYAFYLDDNHTNILEAGVKASMSATTNYRDHDSQMTGQPAAVTQENKVRWMELVLAPYVSTTLQMSDLWWVRGGVRYVGTDASLRQLEPSSSAEDVSHYSGSWLPTLHITYSPGRSHKVSLRVNSAITQPKYQDLNPFVWQTNAHTFYKGNPRLRPQVSYSSALQYAYGGSFSISGVVESGRDMISAVSSVKGDEVLTQAENAQNRLFLGLSASYYYDKLSWLSASVDGYYGRSKYTALSPLLPERTDGTEWGVNGFLSFSFNESRTWTGYVSGDYTGRTKTAVAIVKPQYSMEMGTSYSLLNRRLTLSLSGLNLFASGYRGESLREGYTIRFDNRYSYPTLYFSVSYKFSNAKDSSSFRSQTATRDIERRF
ncbi:hypothetical protein HMPREF2890_08460 [Porphyromonas sp. HMSC065F10]|nr:hypothetical protein HMPREF2890_08460 [Porphyromonas sp. HMSC065F10]